MLYYSSLRSAILQCSLSSRNLYVPFRGGRFVDRIFRVALVPRVEDNPPACFISANIICGFIHGALAPAMISMSRGLAQWLNITLHLREYLASLDYIKRGRIQVTIEFSTLMYQSIALTNNNVVRTNFSIITIKL